VNVRGRSIPEEEAAVPAVIRFDADATQLSPRRVAEAIRAGNVTDRAFDRFLADEHEAISAVHWTPVAVALRVARWLEELEVKTVVDVGAGVGKFCVASALAGSSCHFIGVEQRPRFVEAARALAELFEVTNRVEFVEGSLGEAPLPDAEAFYLYNPFGENLFEPEDHLDTEVELNDERYARNVADVEDLLHHARVGTYVITYNGFGGRVPDTYKEVRVDRWLPNLLKMWRKYTRIHPQRRARGMLANSE
jgi:predicted RNA methylase